LVSFLDVENCNLWFTFYFRSL